MITRVRLPHETTRRRRLTAALAALALVSLGVMAVIVGHAATASATTVPARHPAGRPPTATASPAPPARAWTRGWTYDTGTQYNGPDAPRTGALARWRRHQLHGQRRRGRRRPPQHHRRGQRRLLDIGPHRDAADNFAGPGGRRDGGQRLDRAAQPVQRPRLLAGVLDAGCRIPGQRRRHIGHDGLLELAVHRRDRHHGGRQRAVRALGHAALRHRPRRPLQRDDRPQQRPAGLLRLPDRLQHLLGDRQPDQHQRRVHHLLPQRNRLLHRDREPGRHVRLAGRRRPRLLPHPRPRHGRRLPERRLRLHLAVQRRPARARR